MRSSRGYLDTLVRSARPAGAARAAVQPDWGPTRIAEPVDEPRAPAPRSTTAPARHEARPEPAVSRPSAPRAPEPRSMDAAPPRTPDAAAPRTIEVAATPQPAAATATRAEPIPEAAVPAPAPPAAAAAAAPTAREEVVRPVALPPLETPRPASIPLPPGTEAALERLEHLARRFSAAHAPAEAKSESDTRADVAPPTESEPSRTETRVVSLEPAPAFAPPRAAEPERQRVEIGSIEVFVTRPPSPAPPAPSVLPARVLAAPPTSRLSRPANAYGFGQG